MKNAQGKILIVEDDKRYGDFIGNALKEENYYVKVVYNAKEALKRIEQDKFDLIITDLRMPEISGIELLQEIKLMGKEVEVMVITSYGSSEIEQEVFEKGCKGYLEKPIELSELISYVEKILEKRP